MPGAGELRWRVTFEQRALDGNGDHRGPYAEVFSALARVDWQRGSESAVNDRLEGRKPAIIVVREWAQTLAVTDDYRLSIEGNGATPGEYYNIKSNVPHKDRGFRNLLAVAGGATG